MRGEALAPNISEFGYNLLMGHTGGTLPHSYPCMEVPANWSKLSFLVKIESFSKLYLHNSFGNHNQSIGVSMQNETYLLSRFLARSKELRKHKLYELLPPIFFLNDKKHIHNMHKHLDVTAVESERLKS